MSAVSPSIPPAPAWAAELEQLPQTWRNAPTIRRVAWDIQPDAGGDPAVFIRVIIVDGTDEPQAQREVRHWVLELLARHGASEFPYMEWVSESELGEVSRQGDGGDQAEG